MYKIFGHIGIILCNRYIYRNKTCCNVTGYWVWLSSK